MHTETQKTLALLGRSVIKAPSWLRSPLCVTERQAQAINEGLVAGRERQRLLMWVEDEAQEEERELFWLVEWIKHRDWCAEGRNAIEDALQDFRSNPMNVGKRHASEFVKVSD